MIAEQMSDQNSSLRDLQLATSGEIPRSARKTPALGMTLL